MLITIVGETTTGITEMLDELGEYVYVPPSRILLNKECIKMTDDADTNRAFYSDIIQGDNLYLHIITEKKYIDRIAKGALTVRYSATLDQIKDEWRRTFNGSLPLSMLLKLKREYGCFDNIPCDLHFVKGEKSARTQAKEVLKLILDNHKIGYKPYLRNQ